MVASAVGLTTTVPVVTPAAMVKGEVTAAKSVPDVAVPPTVKFTEVATSGGALRVTV